MSSVAVVALPGVFLATCVWFTRYCLRQLASARMLLYLTDEQWRVVICLLAPLGGAAFLALEQAR